MTQATGSQSDRSASPIWFFRVAGLVVAWAVWLFLVAAVLSTAGVAGGDGGWVWATLAFAPVVLLTRWVLAPAGHPRRVTTALTAVALLLGVAVYLWAPPSLGRVDRVSRGLPLPADAVQVWVDAVPSDWCLATCSSVERDYVVPDGDAALAALETGLREHGWRRVGAAWCHGGFSVRTGPMSADDPRLVTHRTQNPDLQAIKVLTKARCDG